MEHKLQKQGSKSNMNMKMLICLNVIFMCFIMGRIQSVEAYKNYTVGDSLGWYDKLAKPVDYDKWVSGKSFSLGDFLIFNTDSNHSVTQTYDFKTYNSCDSQGDINDIQWSSIDPNSTMVQPITIPVPLIKEGVTYFFSGDYDGEQCLNGQKFAINVIHGKGLPPNLRDDPNLTLGPTPAKAPAPANADTGGDDQAAPDTVVPADFNHPKKVPEDSTSDDSGDDTKKSNDANFMSNKKGFLAGLIGGVLIFI